VTPIFVRILSMWLSKPTAGTESDLCGEGIEETAAAWWKGVSIVSQ